MAILHAGGDDRVAGDRSPENGGCPGGSWHQVSRDNRFLLRTVMGRNPGSTDSFDNGTAKAIYTLDISKLIASPADGRVYCSLDTIAEIQRGQGDEAYCPGLVSVLGVQDSSNGGPHWGAIDNHSLIIDFAAVTKGGSPAPAGSAVGLGYGGAAGFDVVVQVRGSSSPAQYSVPDWQCRGPSGRSP